MDTTNETFIGVLNSLTQCLDNIGLYVIDVNMDIVSAKGLHSSLEDLRKSAINKEADVYLDVDCFIGNSAWRRVELDQLDEALTAKNITQYLIDKYNATFNR